MHYHPSWSNEAKTHFEEIIHAHGGLSAWNKLDFFKFKLKKFSGALVYAKGLNRTFYAPKEVIVFPKERKTQFIYDSHADTFENGKITYSVQKNTIANGRDLFKKSTFEQWYPEHAAYFFGYAWVNYLSYPFILPQFELLNYRIKKGKSQFEIRFPNNFHTHCQVQMFFFNSENLLQKHNYHAECTGPFVFGAHTAERYLKFKEIQVAQIRKVRPRIGPISIPVYGIYGEIALLP